MSKDAIAIIYDSILEIETFPPEKLKEKYQIIYYSRKLLRAISERQDFSKIYFTYNPTQKEIDISLGMVDQDSVYY